ncbi:LytTR family DNA-binding domain-containing protein [Dokdonia ponticola]|uniref:LytTR family DNA-binding domain-containing protein n=1 Tax=Dokdonia ponticola TaxID=2041041 RepID=A0ABV9HWB7_9FLAO
MKKQYPFHNSIQNHFWIAIGVSIWVFVFLYLSEPFDIHRFSTREKLILLPIYGLIEGFCYAIPLVYQYCIAKKQRVWYVINECVFLLLVVGVGTFVNYLFYKFAVVPEEEGVYSYFEYTKFVYLPGLTVILPFVSIARFILGKFSERVKLESQITIKGKGQYDFIQLNFQELLYVQSSDNYVEVYFFKGEAIEKKLVRRAISEIEKSFPELLKTHRSFLINPIHFRHYHIEDKKLFIDVGHTTRIPVSRGLQGDVKSKLQLATNT